MQHSNADSIFQEKTKLSEMLVKVVKKFNNSDVSKVATLYESAFGQKLRVAIPNADHRRQLFEQSFNSEFCLSAYRGEDLLGIAGLQTPHGALASDINLSWIFKTLGIIRGLKALTILALFDRKPKLGQLVMDGIAVDASCRGQGIGTLLLKGVLQYGLENGYEQVRLDVIDTNPKAKKLYLRMGFKELGTYRSKFFEKLVGFSAATTMVYDLKAEA